MVPEDVIVFLFCLNIQYLHVDFFYAGWTYGAGGQEQLMLSFASSSASSLPSVSLVTASSAQLTSAIWKMLVAASSLRDGDGQDMKTANRNRRRLALEAIKASLRPW